MRRWLTPGRLVLAALLGAAAVIVVIRFARGLGGVTALSDRFPWGLWNGFKLSAIAIAAGGFTMAAAGYIFHLERYKSLVRPAVVVGFLGYLTFIVTLMIDLGRPDRIWHPIVLWNPHSVMFEVAWCVMLYTSVLALEFGQIVLERLRWTAQLRLTRLALPPLVIAGVILSMLHQSSLGSLFLIVPGKLHALWFSPLLPVFFFVSAVTVAPAVVTLASFFSARVFHRAPPLPLLVDLGRAMVVLLAAYLGLKVIDLGLRGALSHLLVPSFESGFFVAEVALGVITPLVLLSLPGRNGLSRLTLGVASGLVVFGVILNRLNVSITGMLSGSHAVYFPTWMEIVVTLGLLAGAFLAYMLIAQHLPVFPPAQEEVRGGVAPAPAP